MASSYERASQVPSRCINRSIVLKGNNLHAVSVHQTCVTSGQAGYRLWSAFINWIDDDDDVTGTCPALTADILACDRLNSTAYHRCVRLTLSHEATRPHHFQSTTTTLVANRRTRHTSSALSSTTQQLDECRPTLLQSAAATSSRSPLRAASRGDYVVPRTTEDSQIKHVPLLHDGRGTNCRLILQEAQLSQRGRAMLRVCL